jgi:LCP family protein required for cell wall assembly
MLSQRSHLSTFAMPAPRRHLAPIRMLVACFLIGAIVLPAAAGAAIFVALDGVFSTAVHGVFSGDTMGLAAPALPPSEVEAPEWTDKGRVNVLLLGSDHRDGAGDLSRTDTIIVVTLDPASHTAGMLSLPRDLWVAIPGYGNERINAAYALGENAKQGGGPDLARKTVEQLIGVPIQHYALVGFSGFEKLVDQVGGVVVDVERPIRDDEYPDGNYGLRRIYFQPGLQRLDGETALWYVRSRHADSDFGRARRQQQFLLALRHQALQLNLLPKAPAILGNLAGSIQTDLRATDILSLARVAKDVDTSRLVNRVVDETMTTHWVTPAGAQVEVPNKAAVKRLVQEVFGTTPKS